MEKVWLNPGCEIGCSGQERKAVEKPTHFEKRIMDDIDRQCQQPQMFQHWPQNIPWVRGAWQQIACLLWVWQLSDLSHCLSFQFCCVGFGILSCPHHKFHVYVIMWCTHHKLHDLVIMWCTHHKLHAFVILWCTHHKVLALVILWCTHHKFLAFVILLCIHRKFYAYFIYKLSWFLS